MIDTYIKNYMTLNENYMVLFTELASYPPL